MTENIDSGKLTQLKIINNRNSQKEVMNMSPSTELCQNEVRKGS